MATTFRSDMSGGYSALQVNGADVMRFGADISGQLDSFRNKFIGGHFDQNPWLRGTSFTVTVSGTYVADRWRIDFDGSANITVAKVALPMPQVINGIFCRYGMKITINSKSGNTYIRLSQRIEGVDTLTTRAATLQTAVQGSGSFSVPVAARQNFGTGGSPSADVVTPMVIPLAVTASMQQLNTGLIVPDISLKSFGTGNDFLAAEFDLMSIAAGGYIIIALSGLEYGSIATVWEDRRRIELALCQRYLPVFQANDTASGFAEATNSSLIAIPFPVTARSVPTGFTVTAPTAPKVYSASGAGISTTGINFVLGGQRSAFIEAVTAGSMTAGSGTLFQANGCVIQFNGCEL